MSDTIIKLDDDYYCVWSRIVDAPTAWGTKAEVEAYLVEQEMEHVQRQIDARFARADIGGTSSMVDPWPHEMNFQNVGYIEPDELKAFLESYNAADDAFDRDYIKPWKEAESRVNKP